MNVKKDYPPSIMIIDNVIENTECLVELLKNEGYEILLATDGKEALHIVEERQPDLILLDITMPGMNDFEVFTKLQDLPDTKAIPVMLLTARVEWENIIKGLSLGAVDYIIRPYNSKEILAKVKTHVTLKKTRESLVKSIKELEEERANLAELNKKFQKEEHKFRILFETASLGIVIINREGKIVKINKKTEEIFGYGNDELTGKKIEVLVPEYFRENHIKYMDEYIKSPSIRMMRGCRNKIGKRKEGKEIFLDVSMSYIETETERLFIIFIIDITKRKRSDRLLTYRFKKEELIAGISNRFISIKAHTFKSEILQTLKAIGEFEKADRSFLYFFSPYNSEKKYEWTIQKFFIKSHEFASDYNFEQIYDWTAPKINTLNKHIIYETIASHQWFIDRLKSSKSVYIPDINLLPGEAKWLKQNLKDDGIFSLLLLPLTIKDRLVGIFGLTSEQTVRNWKKEDIEFLKLVGEIIVSSKERFLAEEDLRNNEKWFRSLFEAAPLGIIITDSKNNITIVNKKAEELFGYNREELEKENINILILEYYTDYYINYRKNLKHRPAGNEMDVYGKTKNGSEIPLGIALSPIKIEDETFYINFINDNTEIKEREKEREKFLEIIQSHVNELHIINGELARTARLKDEFLANMSHELRTPLNAILGMSEIILEEIYGPLNDEQKKSIQILEDSGRHLLSLINDILDLSKIEAGKCELYLEPVSVLSACESGLRMVKQLAHKKRINIATKIDSDVTVLYSDVRRLKQILVNLLNNAIKFTPAGGQAGLDVSGDREKNTIYFTVWDKGIGIEKNDMARLFKPFIQIDSKLSRKYEGTGLGLTLVARLSELLGGSVSVESEINKGSRFTVRLPWNKITEIEEEKDITPSNSTELPVLPDIKEENNKRKLILLAEDNRITITIYSKYLTEKKYNLIIACNGLEAIEMAKKEKPDLILMDIQMPVMDGLEAIKGIRANDEHSSVPIIALTALAMSGDREKCIEAGADEYLAKPVSLKKLVMVIEDLLARKKRSNVQ